MACLEDVKLAQKFIADTHQRIADGRAEITRIMDDIDACLEKIGVVVTSIGQNCEAPQSSSNPKSSR